MFVHLDRRLLIGTELHFLQVLDNLVLDTLLAIHLPLCRPRVEASKTGHHHVPLKDMNFVKVHCTSQPQFAILVRLNSTIRFSYVFHHNRHARLWPARPLWLFFGARADEHGNDQCANAYYSTRDPP